MAIFFWQRLIARKSDKVVETYLITLPGKSNNHILILYIVLFKQSVPYISASSENKFIERFLARLEERHIDPYI